MIELNLIAIKNSLPGHDTLIDCAHGWKLTSERQLPRDAIKRKKEMVAIRECAEIKKYIKIRKQALFLISVLDETQITSAAEQ